MQSTRLIQRMAISPDPIGWYSRMYRREMLKSMQPVDDPTIVTVRPYGIAKNIGMTQFPQDYTMRHYGGTLRGRKIGMWSANLMVAPDPQPVNAPTMLSWRSSAVMPQVGDQWVTTSAGDRPEEV